MNLCRGNTQLMIKNLKKNMWLTKLQIGPLTRQEQLFPSVV